MHLLPVEMCGKEESGLEDRTSEFPGASDVDEGTQCL